MTSLWNVMALKCHVGHTNQKQTNKKNDTYGLIFQEKLYFIICQWPIYCEMIFLYIKKLFCTHKTALIRLCHYSPDFFPPECLFKKSDLICNFCHPAGADQPVNAGGYETIISLICSIFLTSVINEIYMFRSSSLTYIITSPFGCILIVYIHLSHMGRYINKS